MSRYSKSMSDAMTEVNAREAELLEVSPPGFKGTVKAMKKHDEIDNPYALAWYMKNKGDKAHYKDKDGKPEKKEKYKNEEVEVEEGIGSLKNAKRDTEHMRKAAGHEVDKQTTTKTKHGSIIRKTTYKNAKEILRKRAEKTREMEKKAKASYLEPDLKKRQANNEKARKDMEKMAPKMRNPHLEQVEIEETAYGWSTKKTENGYEWRITKTEFKKPQVVVSKGTSPSRAIAMSSAKKGVMKYRNIQKKHREMNEVSNELLARYKTKAAAQASAADKAGDYAKGNKRFSGITRATNKQFANDAKETLRKRAEKTREMEKKYRSEDIDALHAEALIENERMVEELEWKVKLQGLPIFYVPARSAASVRAMLRKQLKRPTDIISIERAYTTKIRKDYRQRIAGKDTEEQESDS